MRVILFIQTRWNSKKQIIDFLILLRAHAIFRCLEVVCFFTYLIFLIKKKYYLEDRSIYPFVEHSRKVVCPHANFEHLVSQDLDGVFLIGVPFGGKTPRAEIECYYRELAGALWPKIANYKLIGKWNKVKRLSFQYKSIFQLPINQRFRIIKDQFVVKCWSNFTMQMGMIERNYRFNQFNSISQRIREHSSSSKSATIRRSLQHRNSSN